MRDPNPKPEMRRFAVASVLRTLVALVVIALVVIGTVTPAGSVSTALQFQSGRLHITIHDPRDRTRIAGVVQTFNQARHDLLGLGLSVPKIELVASANAAHFTRLTGEPATIAAVSIDGGTDHNIISQRLEALHTRGLLRYTIRHELFHSAQPKRLPRWLAEGLARHFSGEASTDPPRDTGLETKTATQLNALLEARTSPTALNRAYFEASKRALKLIRSDGWKRTLERE